MRSAHPFRSFRAHLALFASAVVVAACAHGPATLAPAPTTAPEIAIYRTIAESIYVPTTHRSVGIVTALLDTTCAEPSCRPLDTRWGLDPLWWATGDSSSARASRANLLARIGTPLSLATVSEGQPLLQSVAPDSASAVAAQADTTHWSAFKAAHGGLSGMLRFSPIGFDATRHAAIVFVDWQCGPRCGHTVAVALSNGTNGVWHIDDMLLLSSRAPRGALGMR